VTRITQLSPREWSACRVHQSGSTVPRSYSAATLTNLGSPAPDPGLCSRAVLAAAIGTLAWSAADSDHRSLPAHPLLCRRRCRRDRARAGVSGISCRSARNRAPARAAPGYNQSHSCTVNTSRSRVTYNSHSPPVPSDAASANERTPGSGMIHRREIRAPGRALPGILR
jgi:hypothetical protein